MAELVDAPASGAGAGNGVEVRVLFRAPFSCALIFASGCENPTFLPYLLKGVRICAPMIAASRESLGAFEGAFWKNRGLIKSRL